MTDLDEFKELSEDQDILLEMAQKYLIKLQFSENRVNTLNKAIAVLTKLRDSLNK